MDCLSKSFLRLIKEHSNDERLIIPLFKTLDYLFESDEFARWKKGIAFFSNDLLAIISQDVMNSKSISKLLAISGLMVGLFNHVTKEFQKNAFLMLSNLLTHK